MNDNQVRVGRWRACWTVDILGNERRNWRLGPATAVLYHRGCDVAALRALQHNNNNNNNNKNRLTHLHVPIGIGLVSRCKCWLTISLSGRRHESTEEAPNRKEVTTCGNQKNYANEQVWGGEEEEGFDLLAVSITKRMYKDKKKVWKRRRRGNCDSIRTSHRNLLFFRSRAGRQAAHLHMTLLNYADSTCLLTIGAHFLLELTTSHCSIPSSFIDDISSFFFFFFFSKFFFLISFIDFISCVYWQFQLLFQVAGSAEESLNITKNRPSWFRFP